MEGGCEGREEKETRERIKMPYICLPTSHEERNCCVLPTGTSKNNRKNVCLRQRGVVARVLGSVTC